MQMMKIKDSELEVSSVVEWVFVCLCVCTYVCMYIRRYACVCMSLCVNMYVYTYACTVCVSVCMYVHTTQDWFSVFLILSGISKVACEK